MIEAAIVEKARTALFEFEEEDALEIVKGFAASGGDPIELLTEAFIPAINELGDKFSMGEVFLPELVMASEVMKAVTGYIDTELPKTGDKKKAGIVVIGTVEGDIHDIGKTLVVSLLGANGFEVHDLGRDVSVDDFIAKVKEVNADIVGSSTLLTTTMDKQRELEEALRSAGLRDRVRTMVGGAPVTRRWAEKIGADAYAEDAQDAVAKARELMAMKQGA